MDLQNEKWMNEWMNEWKCSEKELDTVGERASGADAQPVVSPDNETVDCDTTCMDDDEDHKFSANQRENHVRSDLDTISLNVDSRDTKKLKFLMQEPKFQ